MSHNRNEDLHEINDTDITNQIFTNQNSSDDNDDSNLKTTIETNSSNSETTDSSSNDDNNYNNYNNDNDYNNNKFEIDNISLNDLNIHIKVSSYCLLFSAFNF